MKIYKNYLLVLLFVFTQTLFASSQLQTLSESPLDTTDVNTPIKQNKVNGLIVLDYEVISLPDNQSIDLLGGHYLHQLNDWLYLGIGVHAPLVKGDYGGFMTLDATIHAQRKVYGDLFVNGGTSLGGGGGGSSRAQSKELSGTSGFIKSYIGLGYELNENISVGANYTYFSFRDSQINSSQVNFFIQAPVSYLASSYANAGKAVQSSYNLSESNENIFILEMNNIFQIDPTGTKKQTINSIALQFSHFIDDSNYLFCEGEVGYKGLPLYNHILPGVGHKSLISSRVNLYSQVGIGSGGFSPDEVDTGSGLLINPKFSLEYLLTKKLGVSLSSGYLFAPTGTSKNYTIGTAINYHITQKYKNSNGFNTTDDFKYEGVRFNLFTQTEFDAKTDDKAHHDVNLLSTQFDNLIGDYWYVPVQVSIAYNDFQGSPGYGEILAGVGVQNKYVQSDNFQNFFQLLIGSNHHGIIFKPSIGTNYSLSDNYALYGQFGKTISVNSMGLYQEGRSFSAYNIGVGLTYRFSL